MCVCVCDCIATDRTGLWFLWANLSDSHILDLHKFIMGFRKAIMAIVVNCCTYYRPLAGSPSLPLALLHALALPFYVTSRLHFTCGSCTNHIESNRFLCKVAVAYSYSHVMLARWQHVNVAKSRLYRILLFVDHTEHKGWPHTTRIFGKLGCAHSTLA